MAGAYPGGGLVGFRPAPKFPKYEIEPFLKNALFVPANYSTKFDFLLCQALPKINFWVRPCMVKPHYINTDKTSHVWEV